MSYYTKFQGIAIVAAVTAATQIGAYQAHAGPIGDCPNCCSNESISTTLPDYLSLLGDLRERARSSIDSAAVTGANSLLDLARDAVATSGDPLDLQRFNSLRPSLSTSLANGLRDFWNLGLGSPYDIVLQETSEARAPASATGPFFPPLTSGTGSLSPIFRFDTPSRNELPTFIEPLLSGDESRFLNDLASRTTLGVSGTLNYGPWSIETDITANPESHSPYLSVEDIGLNFGFRHDIHVGTGVIQLSASADLVLGRGPEGHFGELSGAGVLTALGHFSPDCNCETRFSVPEPGTASLLGVWVLGIIGCCYWRKRRPDAMTTFPT